MRSRLIIRSTGRIVGTVRYGQIEIERGGVISGQIEHDERKRCVGIRLASARHGAERERVELIAPGGGRARLPPSS